MRNTLICDAYEPGSTFKVLTMAAALDAGAAKLSDGFYCSGSVYVEGGRIKCWGKPHGAETLAQGLQNSCNPVFVELALRLGADRFYDYLEKFGIGSATGVDLSGEADGIVIGPQPGEKGRSGPHRLRTVRGRNAPAAIDGGMVPPSTGEN